MEDKPRAAQPLLHHNNKNKTECEKENFQLQILQSLEKQCVVLHNIDETLQQLFLATMEQEKTKNDFQQNKFQKERENKKNIRFDREFEINQKRRNRTKRLFHGMVHSSESYFSSSESDDIQQHKKNKELSSCKTFLCFSIRLLF